MVGRYGGLGRLEALRVAPALPQDLLGVAPLVTAQYQVMAQASLTGDADRAQHRRLARKALKLAAFLGQGLLLNEAAGIGQWAGSRELQLLERGHDQAQWPFDQYAVAVKLVIALADGYAPGEEDTATWSSYLEDVLAMARCEPLDIRTSQAEALKTQDRKVERMRGPDQVPIASSSDHEWL